MIEEFNEEEYENKVEEFLNGKGSIEDGNAAGRIIEFIESL
jgi:hypothetical protein